MRSSGNLCCKLYGDVMSNYHDLQNDHSNDDRQ